MTGEEEVILVYLTHPSREEALKLANLLVEERLVACANVGPEMTSVYEWEGKKKWETEYAVVMKTIRSRFSTLEKRIFEKHPYDSPCLLAVPVVQGAQAFLDWIVTKSRDI